MRSMLSKKKRLFFSLLFSYFLLLTIPILVYMGVFIKASYEIQEGINDEYWKSVVQLKTTVDKKLIDIEKLSFMIGWDQRVGKIYSMKGQLEPTHIYAIKEIIDDFQTIKSSNSYIYDFFVYFSNNDFVLNSYGKFNTSEFYKIYCKNDKLSYGRWLDYISRSYNSTYNNIDLINQKSKNINTYYIQSFPVGLSKVKPSANLVVMLNRDEIETVLKSMQWIKESTVLIINSNNQLVASTKDMKLPNFLQYQKLQNEKSIFYRNIVGENTVVFSTGSGICDWKYVVLLPTGVFLKNIKTLSYEILLGIIVCIAIGGYAAFYFARQNYSPVSKMIEFISNKLGIKNELRANEYAFIENTLMQVIDEKEKVNSRMNEHMDVLRTDFLTRLIRGRLEDQNIEESFRRYDIKFPNEYFMVMIFDIEESKTAILNTRDENDRMLAYFIVRNIMEELLGAGHTTCFFDVGNMFCCILNIESCETGKINESYITAMETGITFLEEKFGLYITVAASNIHHGEESIPESYMEAEDAMDYKILLGCRKILLYSEVKSNPATGRKILYSLGDQQRFMNSIKTGNFESARLLMNGIIEEVFLMGNLSTDMTKCLMFSIINTLLNAISEVSFGNDDEFWNELNAVNRLVRSGTIIEMKHEMNAILNSVKIYVESRRQMPDSSKNDRLNKVKRYIDTNYKDENLSVTRISENFGINQSYLSRSFKEQVGEGVLDYICRIRLEMAQKLLVSTQISIKETGSRVGFYNSNAFIRCFKKHFGITPGQYRELYIGQKNFDDSKKMNMD